MVAAVTRRARRTDLGWGVPSFVERSAATQDFPPTPQDPVCPCKLHPYSFPVRCSFQQPALGRRGCERVPFLRVKNRLRACGSRTIFARRE
jgi:hypothetical protein